MKKSTLGFDAKKNLKDLLEQYNHGPQRKVFKKEQI